MEISLDAKIFADGRIRAVARKSNREPYEIVGLMVAMGLESGCGVLSIPRTIFNRIAGPGADELFELLADLALIDNITKNAFDIDTKYFEPVVTFGGHE